MTDRHARMLDRAERQAARRRKSEKIRRQDRRQARREIEEALAS